MPWLDRSKQNVIDSSRLECKARKWRKPMEEKLRQDYIDVKYLNHLSTFC